LTVSRYHDHPVTLVIKNKKTANYRHPHPSSRLKSKLRENFDKPSNGAQNDGRFNFKTLSLQTSKN
jgi:hypothetical protein